MNAATKTGEFSVCQFFEDGTYEYVRRFVGAQEAVEAARHYTDNVAVRAAPRRKGALMTAIPETDPFKDSGAKMPKKNLVAAAGAATTTPATVDFARLLPGAPLPGGVFAGLSYPKGVVQALILGPEHDGELTWDAAMAWAAGLRVKGYDDWTLPTRAEQALLWTNLKNLFLANWYWSCEQHESLSDFAWLQGFGNGYQDCWRTGSDLRARAVRRLIIQ